MGLIDRGVDIELYQLPRMRDPRSLAAVIQLSKVLREQGIEMAHILVGGGELWLAVLAWLLMRVRDIPVTSTMIVPDPNFGERLPPAFQSFTNYILAGGSDVIIVNGRAHVPLVHKAYKVSRHRIAHVPLGPRTTAIRWPAATKMVPEENGMILFFGRVIKYKGLEYLIKAQPLITSQIPDARIVVAGRGPDLKRCRGLIREESKFEIYDRYVPNDMAAELFMRCSLVALPYTSASSSGILMTAYVFGKPTVVSRAGILPEYVQDEETGLIVPPADPEELANAIIRMLSDQTLRRRMGQNAARWVSDGLSPRNVAIQTQRAYQQALAIHHP